MHSLRGLYNFLVKQEVWSRVGGGVYAQWEHLRTQGWMGHVREYSSREVADFLAATGFVVEQVIYRGDWSQPIARGLSACVPGFRPYFSCIARKPA